MPGDTPPEVHGSARYEWERIVRRVLMPGSAKCVALAMATYANADGTSIYPGNERLSAVTCHGDKTVRRALAWLRSGYLIERTREGSRGGRGGFADEYRLTIPSDLLTRHNLLSPDESPVTTTGDNAPADKEHRSPRPVPPVTEAGSPVTESQNTGHRDRTPTQYQPQPKQDQRESLVRDVTARGDDAANLYARLAAFDELDAARQRRKGA